MAILLGIRKHFEYDPILWPVILGLKYDADYLLGHTTRIAKMGAAYFIVLERKIDGLDTGMDGKSISAHMESLDEAARQLGVRPLSEFFSADPAQMAEFMEGEGIKAGDGELPLLQQFTLQRTRCRSAWNCNRCVPCTDGSEPSAAEPDPDRVGIAMDSLAPSSLSGLRRFPSGLSQASALVGGAR